ncbi:MAG: hypothetical protein K0S33_1143 [Bacteroidetes bacterium]|jgi:hypothetical protein|nr:hypothetical protein [Bacteroidota bacterium]
MKKGVKITLVAITIVITVFTWVYLRDSKFVARNFELYTGIKKECVETFSYYDDHQSFYGAIVSINSIDELMKRKKFVQGPFDNKGYVPCPFINSEKNDYLYSIEKTASYGYILIMIEKKNNLITLYEFYGD